MLKFSLDRRYAYFLEFYFNFLCKTLFLMRYIAIKLHPIRIVSDNVRLTLKKHESLRLNLRRHSAHNSTGRGGGG